VKNAAGNSSTANTTATVTNATPVVAFSATSAASGAPGVTVNFHGSFTDKGARDATWAYTVVWGDGTPNTTGTTTTPITATTPLSVSHAYSTAGTWSAYMTVKDKDGATGTSAKTTVTVSAPSAPLTASANGPYSGAEGAGIQFSSTGSGAPAGRTLSYAWRFGDGTTSTAANPLKTYADNGTYAVRLIVTDGSGAADTATTSATVSNVAPTASFTPPAAVEGTAYTLSLSGATDRGSTDRSSLQYSLDCGQGAGFTAWGTTSSASCPAVPDQRTLTVQGRVRDKDGAVTSYTKALAVANAAPVVAFSATTATSVVRGATVGFRGSFTDKGANDATWSYTIVWGDGTTNKTGTMTAQGALPAVSHVYSTAGTWKATLKVTDKDGASTTSAAVTVTVTVTPPSKLTATGFKDKGDEYARLAWTKGSATTVDVWRGSSKIRSAISNTGAYTDHIGKHANGTYTYKVCIAGKTGTTNCSNSASVNF